VIAGHNLVDGRGKQLGLLDYVLTTAKKHTKREKFISEMEVVVPGSAPPSGVTQEVL